MKNTFFILLLGLLLGLSFYAQRPNQASTQVSYVSEILGQQPKDGIEGAANNAVRENGDDHDEETNDGDLDEQEDEFEDDSSEDLDEQIREMEAEQKKLKRRLGQVEQRVMLLKEVRQLKIELSQINKKVELAEDKNDEEALEKLEDDIRGIELKLATAEARLQIQTQKMENSELLAELREENVSKQLRKRADGVVKLVDQGEKLIEKYADAIKAEDEDKAEDIFEEFEGLIEEIEMNRRFVFISIELNFAREEGDDEAIEELESELKAITDELGESDKDDNASSKNGTGTVKVVLSEADIKRASTLNFERQIVPLLKASCFQCHDANSSSGELDLQELVSTKPMVVNRRHWLNVIQQLKVRSMPPVDAKQPSDADRITMLAWLDNAINRFDYTTVQRPGHEPAKRLTHEEYNNTIRDLTGIDLRPTDRFPTDMTATSGFENSGNSLFLQPILMERYVNAADYVVNSAWPLHPQAPQQKAAWSLLVGRDDISKQTGVRNVLKRFLSRAYRRPVEDEALKKLLIYHASQLKSGANDRDAIRGVLQIVFVSPHFLIRSEHSREHNSWFVDDWEMASRLSYFLWSSMPDEELFELARTGQLQEPATLRKQVDRMLADPKAKALGSNFALQWLGVNNIDRVQRDQIDNPWATDSLVEAMERETSMVFNSLVANNEPIERLIDAKFTFVNSELARHYGMNSVKGERMRRISLLDSPRQGILGHGSILTVTSHPHRTSPVRRGEWILTNLLGTPPPPPPPNVSELDERLAENERLTQRQKLERHRSNPNCYACHSEIDPLGFALEEFEWFGRYRGTRRNGRVDATGQLPGGQSFSGLKGLAEALLRDRIDDLTRQVTSKLLSYALGRQLEFYDEATVDDLVKHVESKDRRFQALIHAIVQSDAFRKQQAK